MNKRGSNLLFTIILIVMSASFFSGCAEENTPSPHPDDWADPQSNNFHGLKISAGNWNLESCTACHGDDLTGTEEVTGCQTSSCHTSEGGIYACDNCHAAQSSAYFYNLDDDTASSILTVGAHNNHIFEGANRTAIACSECHLIPTDYSDVSHLDNSQFAEVAFGPLATDSGRLAPTWDRNSGSCSNVYCHGNFTFMKSEASPGNQFAYLNTEITGSNPDLIWNSMVDVACGDCHSLVPSGHFNNPSCSSCHTAVVESDNATIKDKTKHINGQRNVFGN